MSLNPNNDTDDNYEKKNVSRNIVTDDPPV